MEDLLLRYRLQWPSFVMDSCQWVERDIYVQCPREEGFEACNRRMACKTSMASVENASKSSHFH